MRLEVSRLSRSLTTTIEEEVVFDAEKFTCHAPLLEVLSTKVKAEVNKYEDFIDVFLSVTSKVSLQCSYTLKPFEKIIKGSEEYHFSSYKEDEDDETIIYRGNFIELDEIIFNLLSASIPLSPVAPGAKLPKGDKNCEIISEDDYLKEKKEHSNNAFAALENYKFDEEN